LVLSYLPENGKVGVLGLSYKPDTNVVEESQGLELARSLIDRDVPVVLYDPWAMDNARQELGNGAVFASSLQACVQQSDVIVITAPWSEFKEVQAMDLNHKSHRSVIIDAWRILDGKQFADVADYVTLGVG